MARTSLATALATVVLALLAAPPPAARADETKTLRQEIDALKEGQDALRRELEELKALLRDRRDAVAPRRGHTIGVRVADAPFRGSAAARVTVVEFSDYQCPYCARHHRETLPQLERDYIATGKVRYVARDFPLGKHERARPAAIAAACADEQGRFWEMHDALFATPIRSREGAIALARRLGLDAERFAADLRDPTVRAEVDRQRALCGNAQVRGVPTFFINGRRMVGSRPRHDFQRVIDEERQ